jgi:ABC-type nickel/cobalt efflux system permease component RcnA
MDVVVMVAIVALIVVLAALVVWRVTRRRRHLEQRFGPEYEHTVARSDSRRDAERELSSREQRREALEIRPLGERERSAYTTRWEALQAHFVDAPAVAVRESDELITEVMRARGYPVEDFDQRAADVSVDHPQVVEHYRSAHDVARRQRDGEVSTEDLRRALLDYRRLFDRLVPAGGDGDAAHAGAAEEHTHAPEAHTRDEEVRS